MLYIEVLLLAIGLSMDSLAVSVTSGAVLRDRCSAGSVVKIASTLGLFQAGMTVIGYTMGLGFERYIRAFDHWVAFALLGRRRRKAGSTRSASARYVDWASPRVLTPWRWASRWPS